MIDYCIVKDCRNNSKKTEKSKSIRYFCMPTIGHKDSTLNVLAERRLLVWLQILNRDDYFIDYKSRNQKICSLHFSAGKAKLLDVDSPDWVPHLQLELSKVWKSHIEYFELQEFKDLADNFVQLKKEKRQRERLSKVNPVNLEECTVCLEHKKSIIKIDWRQDKFLGIEKVLDEFFDKEKFFRTNSICVTCWHEIKRFNNFYSKAKQKHEDYQVTNCFPEKRKRQNSEKEMFEKELFKTYDHKFCDICKVVSFGNFSHVISHYKKVHNIVKELLCYICTKKYRNKMAFLTHMVAHKYKNKTELCCHLCNVKFSTQNLLEGHMVRVHGHINRNEMQAKNASIYKCSACGVMEPRVSMDKQESMGTSDYMECEFCADRTLIRRTHRKQHMKLMHGNTKMHCRKCDGMVTVLSFENHIKNCGRLIWKCKLCHQEYNHPEKLKSHMSVEHITDTRTKCEFCDKKFDLRFYAVRHSRIEHKEEFRAKYPFGTSSRAERSVERTIEVLEEEPEYYDIEMLDEDL